ncbi:Factor arrest protein 11 [Saitozyma podzolica]|uniref:Factor arrest protein 11 n=1 Tax=Saitozyma podzolica TaxID=1890683 RepID=A0A427XRY6_9TREE|nr:Factor arrest protein 11 [Saitozyma podzolica]
MNFSRFPRTNMFDMMPGSRRLQPPRDPSAYTEPDSSPDDPLPSPGVSAPAPPVLTRPRAGASIVNGQPPAGLSLGGAGAGAGGRDLVEDGTTDSITLGQLKAHTQGMQGKQKEKTQQFDFRYDDTDTIMSELDEFYPYVEMSHVAQNPERFKGSFKGEWTEAPLAKRKAYMELQLEYIESPVADTRRAAQGRLLYLLQGCFAETSSPEMQLHWIMENAKTLRSVDGVATLVTGLRDATKRYNISVDTSDKPLSSSSGSNQGAHPVDPYDDRSAELMDVLAMIYFVVEVSRGDETFGDELMAMDPPLPLVLFQMLASLKDRLPKGYPVKKACMKEVARARALARELSGLSPDDKYFTKASPLDISNFRRDTSVKYPTFAPPQSVSTAVPNEKLAEGFKPIPARPNYHSTEIPSSSRPSTLPQHGAAQTSAPLPGTPAPSPPPSPAAGPKAKKQQFQTDPSRPFVFPYSRSSGVDPTSLVPFAIAEADKLFHKHAYISLGLLQMWQVREDCLREERGMGRSGLIGFSTAFDDEEDEEEMEAMRREWRYDEEEQSCLAQGDKEGARIAREKRAAARRLHRVEIIYRSTLPIMTSCVVVLLKLLLATVTSPGANGLNAGLPGAGLTSPTSEMPRAPENVPPPTREEVDIARHREITSKAVSAIIILMMKWFKASHVLKFHYFTQQLFDSNCLLLVLKMFGLSDVYAQVQSKNEWEDWNFFRYCHLHCSKTRPDPQEDAMLRPVKSRPSPRLATAAAATTTTTTTTTTADGEEEVELITEYSWRNFFSTINFLKVLQKMTKHRSHRTYMLQQYKSTQILKRMLRINHPMLQLQSLKLIKSQMPWCGRKWRQGNMKVITSIYLNCRPELRDDWLAGTDQDSELEDALPQEYALRALIQFYNKRNYSAQLLPAISSPEPSHKRSDSTAAITLEDPALRQHGHGLPHRGSLSESDVFPPRKTDASALPYNPDGMIDFWLHEYEDVLMEVFGYGESGVDEWDTSEFGFGVPSPGGIGGTASPGRGAHRGAPGPAERDDRAWHALGEIMGADEDVISDSESVVSVGELGEEARLDEGIGAEGVFARQQRRRSTDNENTWEHMSPQISLLPRSPAERRRSSSGGSPLRPVLNGRILDAEVFEEDEDLPGPMPIERQTEDERERAFGAVDEVEYAYGE